MIDHLVESSFARVNERKTRSILNWRSKFEFPSLIVESFVAMFSRFDPGYFKVLDCRALFPFDEERETLALSLTKQAESSIGSPLGEKVSRDSSDRSRFSSGGD